MNGPLDFAHFFERRNGRLREVAVCGVGRDASDPRWGRAADDTERCPVCVLALEMGAGRGEPLPAPVAPSSMHRMDPRHDLRERLGDDLVRSQWERLNDPGDLEEIKAAVIVLSQLLTGKTFHAAMRRWAEGHDAPGGTGAWGEAR